MEVGRRLRFASNPPPPLGPPSPQPPPTWGPTSPSRAGSLRALRPCRDSRSAHNLLGMIGVFSALIKSTKVALQGMEARSRGRAGASKRALPVEEVPAPETPTQLVDTAKKRRIVKDCPLLNLPDEVLDRAVLANATPRDLCAVALCCTRLRSLSDVRGERSGPRIWLGMESLAPWATWVLTPASCSPRFRVCSPASCGGPLLRSPGGVPKPGGRPWL